MSESNVTALPVIQPKLSLLDTLAQVTQRKVELDEEARLAGGEVTPEYEALEVEVQALEHLKNKKIDLFVGFFGMIENQIEACEEQTARLKKIHARLKELAHIAVMTFSPEDRRIDGLASHIKVQNNGGRQPVEITRPDDIPNMFKRCSVTLADKFPASDFKAKAVWEQVCSAVGQNFDDCVTYETMIEGEDGIRAMLEGDANFFDGAAKILDRGSYVRIVAGAAKPKKVAGKKKTKEIAND